MQRLYSGCGHAAAENPPPVRGKSILDCINLTLAVSGNFNNVSFGSQHEGGTHFTMCDDDARFVSENVDLGVYKATASRSGGEVNTDQN